MIYIYIYIYIWKIKSVVWISENDYSNYISTLGESFATSFAVSLSLVAKWQQIFLGLSLSSIILADHKRAALWTVSFLRISCYFSLFPASENSSGSTNYKWYHHPSLEVPVV